MQALSQDTLRTFHESSLGINVQVFGNVAVAVAGCEITENSRKVSGGTSQVIHWKYQRYLRSR
jgi:hypothetical protein